LNRARHRQLEHNQAQSAFHGINVCHERQVSRATVANSTKQICLQSY